MALPLGVIDYGTQSHSVAMTTIYLTAEPEKSPAMKKAKTKAIPPNTIASIRKRAMCPWWKRDGKFYSHADALRMAHAEARAARVELENKGR